MAFMNKITNAQNPLGALVGQLAQKPGAPTGVIGYAGGIPGAVEEAASRGTQPRLSPQPTPPGPPPGAAASLPGYGVALGPGASGAGIMQPQPVPSGNALGAGGFKTPQPVPSGPAVPMSSLKLGGLASPGGASVTPGAAPDPSQGLTDWIRHYGSQAGADPSVLNDTPYWERVISENMAKNGGNLDQDYWSYRMTSDPNKGTGYYADRNSGKTPYDGGMPGGGAVLSGLLGGTTGLPQGQDAQALGGQDVTANANSQLQALLAKLMGGQ